ncbi:MAG: peptidoglycan-binding domain-containing protein [Streptosporangiaceae bacterium]
MRQPEAADRHGGTPADPLVRRRFFLAGLAIGLIAMSAVGLASVLAITSPAQVAARSAAPPPTLITAPVRWQVLRNPIVVPGVVRASTTVSVAASAPLGTLIVTRLPARPGDRVRPGQVIAEIDGRPILLLQGRLPAYRDLHEGDTGPDVRQLQVALERLGYADFDPPGVYGPSTALALLLLYRHLGYRAPVYPLQVVPGRPGTHVTRPPIPSAYLPMSEVAYLPAPSALVVAVHARVGHPAAAPWIIRMAVGPPYITGVLSYDQARHARLGMRAMISSPVPPIAARGRVTRIAPIPPPRAFGAGSVTGFPVSVRPDRALAQHLIGTRVRLTLLAPVTTGPVLTVPVTAVFAARQRGRAPAASVPAGRTPQAGPGTATGVRDRTAAPYVIWIGPGGRRRRVPVYTGPTADGLVAIQPVRAGALHRGDRVLIGIGP